MKVFKNYSLDKVVSMALGGKASYFVTVKSENELREAIAWAKSRKVRFYVIGEATNFIPQDQGYKGLLIKNQIRKFAKKGQLVTIGAGNNLLAIIKKLNSLGLAGLEKMAGIPGTVGGAIYGCAGAYGQEIKDHLSKVRFFDGKKIRSFTKKQCRFGYRTSIFKKHKDWTITEASFNLRSGERGELQRISREIIKLRGERYTKGLKSAGSFFKNIKISDLPPKLQKKLVSIVPAEKIISGKIPIGYFLEQVGAKGMKVGGISVSRNHGNLIYNQGKGTYKELVMLVKKLKKLAKKQFGIKIEEEVQYLK
jgi:UDP-N-acetylmuramate dehydrogenase